jgi:hypothetical protein
MVVRQALHDLSVARQALVAAGPFTDSYGKVQSGQVTYRTERHVTFCDERDYFRDETDRYKIS